MRNLVTVLLSLVGLTLAIQAAVSFVSHFAYGAPLNVAAGLEVSIAGAALLIVAWILSGPSRRSRGIVLYYLVAFAGLRVGLLPVYHTGFRGWHAIDVLLLVAGGVTLGSSLLWAHARRTAGHTRHHRGGEA